MRQPPGVSVPSAISSTCFRLGHCIWIRGRASARVALWEGWTAMRTFVDWTTRASASSTLATAISVSRAPCRFVTRSAMAMARRTTACFASASRRSRDWSSEAADSARAATRPASCSRCSLRASSRPVARPSSSPLARPSRLPCVNASTCACFFNAAASVCASARICSACRRARRRMPLAAVSMSAIENGAAVGGTTCALIRPMPTPLGVAGGRERIRSRGPIVWLGRNAGARLLTLLRDGELAGLPDLVLLRLVLRGLRGRAELLWVPRKGLEHPPILRERLGGFDGLGKLDLPGREPPRGLLLEADADRELALAAGDGHELARADELRPPVRAFEHFQNGGELLQVLGGIAVGTVPAGLTIHHDLGHEHAFTSCYWQLSPHTTISFSPPRPAMMISPAS